MDAANGYTRANFVITEAGVHEVVVRKLDINGTVIATSSVYRVFSYSAEYDALTDKDGEAFMADIAARGKGSAISEYWQIYEGFNETLEKNFDPRLLFSAIALAAFLLDIAVRKFKFKWIHELIRERADKNKRG